MPRNESIDVRTLQFLRGLEEVAKAPPPEAKADAAMRDTASVREFAGLAVPRVPGQKPEPAGWVHDRNEYAKHYKGTMYIAIGAIARKVAMQEPIVARHIRKKSGEKYEPLPDHPLAETLRNVNPFHVPFDLWFHTVGWRLIAGTSYWWKARNGLGLPGHIWVLPSQWVWAVPSPTEFIGQYLVKGVFSRDTYIPARDIVQMSEPNLDWSGTGRFYGMPAMAAGGAMVDIEEAMYKRLLATFRNLAPPGLHYETAEELTPEEFRDAYQDIVAQHSLAENTGRPILTHSGMKASLPTQGISEMDYRGSLEASMEFGLAVMGVPKAVVGLVKDSNRSNMTGALMSWVENTINPLLSHTGQTLTKGLAKEYDDDIVVYFPPVKIEEADQIRKDIETCQKSGAILPNEVREILLDRQPFPNGGNRALVPTNLKEASYGSAEAANDVPPAAGDEEDQLDAEVDTDPNGEVDAAAEVAAEKFFRVRSA